MASVEHQVLEVLRLINENVVDAHLLEIHDTILILLHLILDGGYLGGQIFLSLDKTFEHTTGNIVSLLLDDFEILLNRIKFSLQDLLLHLRRLRYLAELVVRHYHAVIVVVLNLIEESDTVLSLETLFIGVQNTGIGIGRLVGHGNLRDIRLHADNHRFVGESETLHLVRCNTHYQCFTSADLMVADATAVLFQHPYTIFLRLVYRADSISVAQQLHIEVRECLMRSIVMWTDVTVELRIVKINQSVLKLRRLSIKPVRKTIADFINLGIG